MPSKKSVIKIEKKRDLIRIRSMGSQLAVPVCCEPTPDFIMETANIHSEELTAGSKNSEEEGSDTYNFFSVPQNCCGAQPFFTSIDFVREQASSDAESVASSKPSLKSSSVKSYRTDEIRENGHVPSDYIVNLVQTHKVWINTRHSMR